MADDPKHLVRTAGLDWSQARHGRHPFNAASEMRIAPLGDRAGLKRMGVHLIRIPPGKESFIPHAHAIQEEYVFILEGRGQVVLDGVATDIGPGDFVGFPTDGVVHHLVSAGPDDLVYLTGGERTNVEVSNMPTIGKVTVGQGANITLYDVSASETLTIQEWMAKGAIPPV